MSDTEIWGPCGHNWLDFACYAAGVLDDEIEARAVEVQAVACAACSDELGDHLELAGLIYEAVVLFAGSSGSARPTPPAAPDPWRGTSNPQRPPTRGAGHGVDGTDGGGLSCRKFPSGSMLKNRFQLTPYVVEASHSL